MTEQSKLEWTEYKSRFRAVTAYGTYWVDTHESGSGYQLICGTVPCCEFFTSPHEAHDYAQGIHDDPCRRGAWFNLSDVEQAPYHAPLDFPELLRTYETLLAGDNLPERIAVQTVDLRALLEATKPVDVATVREALEWYSENTEGCRKITREGDKFRNALDADGGRRAREAIRTLSVEPTQGEQSQDMRALSELSKLTYAIQHNPNCPDKYLVRLPGKSAIDLKPYGNAAFRVPHQTNDILGFGKTLHEAYKAAIAVPTTEAGK